MSELPKGLLLDFGFVCLKSPFELLDQAEPRLGLAPGTLPWRGPFDLAGDALWRELAAGRVSERDYWQRRADEVQALTGRPTTVRMLMGAVFDGDEDDVMRPEARRLVRDAGAAGQRVGILTNDLQAFHGEEWTARVSLLAEVDVVVDASVDDLPLKPDARAYEVALERLGLAASEVLFVDDQEANVRGALEVGLRAVRFDVTDLAGSFRRVRSSLGLDGGR